MKRPWNAVNHPVYSLCTSYKGVMNMNVCTYVTPITMQPKLYTVAVYNNTQTLLNVEKSEHCVLQIMSSNQYKLVNVLGKKTGLKYNKHQYLTKKNALTIWNGFEVLTDAFAYILLRKEKCLYKADHDLYLFAVEQYKTNKGLQPLYFHQLIDNKIILG